MLGDEFKKFKTNSYYYTVCPRVALQRGIIDNRFWNFNFIFGV